MPRLSLLIPAVLALFPASVMACRELSQEKQFDLADTVVVGWISSASIPALEATPPNERLVFDSILNGSRTFRVVVAETRKGAAKPVEVMDVSYCNGSLNNVGDRVIAYRFGSSWRIRRLPFFSVPAPESNGP